MTLFYHPENRLLKIWEIKRVGPGEKVLAYKKDSEKPYGRHRVTLELEGQEEGGLAILTQGWVNPDTNLFSLETGTEASGFTKTEYRVPANRPLIFGGSKKGDVPVVTVSAWMLIVDRFKQSGWK